MSPIFLSTIRIRMLHSMLLVFGVLPHPNSCSKQTLHQFYGEVATSFGNGDGGHGRGRELSVL